MTPQHEVDAWIADTSARDRLEELEATAPQVPVSQPLGTLGMKNTRISPGRWYHDHVKGRYPLVATLEPSDSARVPVKGSIWIVATRYEHGTAGVGLLTIWTKKGDGLLLDDVPPQVPGMLHGFGRMEITPLEQQIATQRAPDGLAGVLVESLEIAP